ncbi:leucine-rich repeat transmembrane protein CCDC168 [Nycticebus coucang]|uniref:leucine-rich repeat transmembrane protein CCDC168 n=1 Tax=Nycticebus coucang TaxID=9470 RepID=UPI00234DB6FF|nr:leucine-rich repeat transmembrane protein CCDC168 [Nycticebus coucang]
MSKPYYFFKKGVRVGLEDNTFLTLWELLESWIIQNDWMAIFFIIFIGIIFEIILIKIFSSFWKKPTIPEDSSSSDTQENEDSCLESMKFAPENWSVIHSSSEERVGAAVEKRITSSLTSEESESNSEDKILSSDEIIRASNSKSEYQVSHFSESHLLPSSKTNSSLSLLHSEVRDIFLSHGEYPENETVQFSSKKLFSIMKTNKNKNSEFSGLKFSVTKLAVEKEDLDVAPCPPAHLLLSRDQVRLLEENVRNQIPSKPKAKLESETTDRCLRFQESLIQNQRSAGMVISTQTQDSSLGQNAIPNEGFYEMRFLSQAPKFVHSQESVNSQPHIKASYCAQPQDLMSKPLFGSTQDSCQAEDLDRSQHFVKMTQESVKGLESDEQLGGAQYPTRLEESNKIKYSVNGQNTIFNNTEFLVLTLSPNSVVEDIPQPKSIKPQGQQQIASSELTQDSVYSAVSLSNTIKGHKNRRTTPDSKSKPSLNNPSLKAKKTPISQVFQITVSHTSKNKNELGWKNNIEKKELHERKDVSDIALHLISASKLISPYIKKYSRKKLVKVMPALRKSGHFLQKRSKSLDTEKINYTGSVEERGISGIIKNIKQYGRENEGVNNILPQTLPHLEQSFMVNTDQLKAPCSLIGTNWKSEESLKEPITQATETGITEFLGPNSKKTFDVPIPKHETPLEEAISEPMQKLVSYSKMELNRTMKIQEDRQSTKNSHLQLPDGEQLPTSTQTMETTRKQDFLEVVLELSNVHLQIFLENKKDKSNEELERVKIQLSTESINLKEKKPLILDIMEDSDLSESEELKYQSRSNIKRTYQDSSDATYAIISEPPDMEMHSKLKAKTHTSRIIRLSHSASNQEKLLDEKKTQDAKYIEKSSVFKKPQQCDREEEDKEKQEEREAISELTQGFRVSIHLKQKPKYLKFKMEQISSEDGKTPYKKQTLSTQTTLGPSPCPATDLFQLEKVKQSTDRPTSREGVVDPKNLPTMPETLPGGELFIKTTEYCVPFGKKETLDGHILEEKQDLKRGLPAVAQGSFDSHMSTLLYCKRQKIKKKSETRSMPSVKDVLNKVKKPSISPPRIHIHGTLSCRKKLGGNCKIISKQILQNKTVADGFLNVTCPHKSILPNTKMHSGLNAENHSHIKAMQEESQIPREGKYLDSTNKGNESQNVTNAKLQDEEALPKAVEALPKAVSLLRGSWNNRLNAHPVVETGKEMHQPVLLTNSIMESIDSPIVAPSHVKNVKRSPSSQTDFKGTTDSELLSPISGQSLTGDPSNQTRESGIPSDGSDTREMGDCFAGKKAELPEYLPATSPETFNCCMPTLSLSERKESVIFAHMTTTTEPKCTNMEAIKPSISQIFSITDHEKTLESDIETKVKKINQAEGVFLEYVNTLYSSIHSRLQREFCCAQLGQGNPVEKKYIDSFAKCSTSSGRKENLQDGEEEEQRAALDAAPQQNQHPSSDASPVEGTHLGKSDPALSCLTQELPINGENAPHQTGFTQTSLEASFKTSPVEAEEPQKTIKTENGIEVSVCPMVLPPKALQAPENSHSFVLNAYQKNQELFKSDEALNQSESTNTQVQLQTHVTQTILGSTLCPILDQFQFEKLESCVRFSPLKSGEANVDEVLFSTKEGGISSDTGCQMEQAGSSEKKEAINFDFCMPDLSMSQRKRNFKRFSDMRTLVNLKCGIIKAKKTSISYMLNITGNSSANHRKELRCNWTTKVKEVLPDKKVADQTYSSVTVTADISTDGKVEMEKDTRSGRRLSVTQVKQEMSPDKGSIASDDIEGTNAEEEEEEEEEGEEEALLKGIPQYSQHFVFCSRQRKDVDVHKLKSPGSKRKNVCFYKSKSQGSRKILFVTEQGVSQPMQPTDPKQGEETEGHLQTQSDTMCAVSSKLSPLKSEESLTETDGLRETGVSHKQQQKEQSTDEETAWCTDPSDQVSASDGTKDVKDKGGRTTRHRSFNTYKIKDLTLVKSNLELRKSASKNIPEAQKMQQQTLATQRVLNSISRFILNSLSFQKSMKRTKPPKCIGDTGSLDISSSMPVKSISESLILATQSDVPSERGPSKEIISSIPERETRLQKDLQVRTPESFDFSIPVSSDFEGQNNAAEALKSVTEKAQIPSSFEIINVTRRSGLTYRKKQESSSENMAKVICKGVSNTFANTFSPTKLSNCIKILKKAKSPLRKTSYLTQLKQDEGKRWDTYPSNKQGISSNTLEARWQNEEEREGKEVSSATGLNSTAGTKTLSLLIPEQEAQQQRLVLENILESVCSPLSPFQTKKLKKLLPRKHTLRDIGGEILYPRSEKATPGSLLIDEIDGSPTKELDVPGVVTLQLEGVKENVNTQKIIKCTVDQNIQPTKSGNSVFGGPCDKKSKRKLGGDVTKKHEELQRDLLTMSMMSALSDSTKQKRVYKFPERKSLRGPKCVTMKAKKSRCSQMLNITQHVNLHPRKRQECSLECMVKDIQPNERTANMFLSPTPVSTDIKIDNEMHSKLKAEMDMPRVKIYNHIHLELQKSLHDGEALKANLTDLQSRSSNAMNMSTQHEKEEKSIISPKHGTLKAKQLHISQLFTIRSHPTEGQRKKKQRHHKYKMKERQWYTSTREELLNATGDAKSPPPKSVLNKLSFHTVTRSTLLSNRIRQWNLDGHGTEEKAELPENLDTVFLGPADFFTPVLSDSESQINIAPLSEREIRLNLKRLTVKRKKSPVSRILKINRQSTTKDRKKREYYLKTLSNRIRQWNLDGHGTEEKAELPENLDATFLGPADFFMPFLSDSESQTNTTQLSEREIRLTPKRLTPKDKKSPVSRMLKVNKQSTTKDRKKLENNIKIKLKSMWQGQNVANTFPNAVYLTPDTSDIKIQSKLQTEMDIGVAEFNHTEPIQVCIGSPDEGIARYSDSIDKGGASNFLKEAILPDRESEEEKQEHPIETSLFYFKNFMANRYFLKEPHSGKSESVLLQDSFFPTSQIYKGNSEKTVKIEKTENVKPGLKVGLPGIGKSGVFEELSETTSDAISRTYDEKEIDCSVLKEKVLYILAEIVLDSIGRHLPTSEQIKRQNRSLKVADRSSPKALPVKAKQSASRPLDPVGHAALSINKKQAWNFKAPKREIAKDDLINQEMKINAEFSSESVSFSKIHLLQIEKQKKEFESVNWKTIADFKTLAPQKQQQELGILGTYWSSPDTCTPVCPKIVRHKDKAQTTDVESATHTGKVRLEAKRTSASPLLGYGTGRNKKTRRGNSQQQKPFQLNRETIKLGLKATYDFRFLTSHTKKLIGIKTQKDKPKKRVCNLPQQELEKPPNEMQMSLSGCIGVSSILRKLEQNIREEEKKHLHIPQRYSQPLRTRSQQFNYSGFKTPQIRTDIGLESLVVQRVKERAVDIAKCSVSIPLEREGSMEIDSPLGSKRQNIFLRELDASQQKTFQEQESVEEEGISMTNLELNACPIMEPLHLENTRRVAKEGDVYLNRKNISYLLRRERFKKPDILLSSKEQKFLCTNLEVQHKTPAVQKEQVNSECVSESILDSVSYPNRNTLHLKQTVNTIRKENVSISESFNYSPKGKEQSKLTSIPLKFNRQKMDFSKNLKIRQLNICNQTKESILESVSCCILHHIINPKKEVSAKEIKSSKSSTVEKALNKVGIPVVRPPCILFRTTQKQEHLSISYENCLEPMSCPQNYRSVLQHLIPPTKEALSEVGNVSSTTKGLDLFAKDQLSSIYDYGLQWIMPLVTPRQINKQNTMLPLESYGEILKYLNPSFPKGKRSSDKTQIIDLLSNGSSPKLGVRKKIESRQENQNVEIICLPVLFSHSLSLCVPVLHESKSWKNSIKGGVMKGILCRETRSLKLKKSVLSHILNPTEYGTPNNRPQRQWNVTEKITNKETTNKVILSNVKRAKQHMLQEAKKGRMEAVTLKGILAPNIIVKAKKSSLSHILNRNELPLLLDIIKQERKLQECKSKWGMRLTTSRAPLSSPTHPNVSSRISVGTSTSGILKRSLPPPTLQALSNFRKISLAESINRGTVSNVREWKRLPQKKKESREDIVDMKDIMGLIDIILKGKKSPFAHLLHRKQTQRNNKKQEQMKQENKKNLSASILSSPHLEWDSRIKDIYVRGVTKFCLPSLTLRELSGTMERCEEPIDDILSSIKKAKRMPQNNRMEITSEEIMRSRTALKVRRSSVLQEIQLNTKEKQKKMQAEKDNLVEIWSKVASISFLPYFKVGTVKGEETMLIKTGSSFSKPNFQILSHREKIGYEKSIMGNISNSVKKALEDMMQKEKGKGKIEKVILLNKNKSSVLQEIHLEVKELEKKTQNTESESGVLLSNTGIAIPSLSHLKLDTRIEKAYYVTEVTGSPLPEQSHQKPVINVHRKGIDSTSDVQKAKEYMTEARAKISTRKAVMHPKDGDLKGKEVLSRDLPSNVREPGKVDREDTEHRRADGEGKEPGKMHQAGKEREKMDAEGKKQGKVSGQAENRWEPDPKGAEQGRGLKHGNEREDGPFLHLSKFSQSHHELHTRIGEDIQGLTRSATSQLWHQESFEFDAAHTKSIGEDISNDVKTVEQYEPQEGADGGKIVNMNHEMPPEGMTSKAEQLPLSHMLRIARCGGSETRDRETSIKENVGPVQKRKSELDEVLTIPSLPHHKLDLSMKGKKEKQESQERSERGKIICRNYEMPPAHHRESSNIGKLKYTVSPLKGVSSNSERTNYKTQVEEDKANVSEERLTSPRDTVAMTKKSFLPSTLKTKELQMSIKEQGGKGPAGRVGRVVTLRKTGLFATFRTHFKLETIKEEEEEPEILSYGPHLALQGLLLSGQMASTKSADGCVSIGKYRPKKEDRIQTVAMKGLTHPSGAVFKEKVSLISHVFSSPEPSPLSKRKELQWDITEEVAQKQDRAGGPSVGPTETYLCMPSPTHHRCLPSQLQLPVSSGAGRIRCADLKGSLRAHNVLLKANKHMPHKQAKDRLKIKDREGRLRPKRISVRAQTPPFAYLGNRKKLPLNIKGQRKEVWEGTSEPQMVPRRASASLPPLPPCLTCNTRRNEKEGPLGTSPFHFLPQKMKDSSDSGKKAYTESLCSCMLSNRKEPIQSTTQEEEKDRYKIDREGKMLPKCIRPKAKKVLFSNVLNTKDLKWKIKEQRRKIKEDKNERVRNLTNTKTSVLSPPYRTFHSTEGEDGVIRIIKESSDARRLSCVKTTGGERSNDVRELTEKMLQKDKKDREKVLVDMNSVVDPNRIYSTAKKPPILHTHNLSDLQLKTREQEEKIQKVKSRPVVILTKSSARSPPPHLDMNAKVKEETIPALTISDSGGGIYIQPTTSDRDIIISLTKGKLPQDKEEAGVQIVNIIMLSKHQEKKVQECEDEPGVVLTKSPSLSSLPHLILDKETDDAILRFTRSVLQRLSHAGETSHTESFGGHATSNVKKEKQHVPQKEEKNREKIVDRRGTDITLKSRKSPLSSLLHRSELHLDIRGREQKEHGGEPPGRVQRKICAFKPPLGPKLDKSTQVDGEKLGSDASALLPQILPELSGVEKTANTEAKSGDVRKRKPCMSQNEEKCEVKTVEMRIWKPYKEARFPRVSHIINKKEFVLNIDNQEEKVQGRGEVGGVLVRTSLSKPASPPLCLDSGNKMDKDTPGITGSSCAQQNFQVSSDTQKIGNTDSVAGDGKNVVKQTDHQVSPKEGGQQGASDFMISVQQGKEPSRVKSEGDLNQLGLNFQGEDIYFKGFGTIRSGKRLEWLFPGQKSQPEKYKTETFTVCLSCPTMDARKIGSLKKNPEIMDSLNYKISPKVSVSLPGKTSREMHVTHGSPVSVKDFSVSERYAHQQETSSEVFPESEDSYHFAKPEKDVPSNDRIRQVLSSKGLALQTKGSLEKINITKCNSSKNKDAPNSDTKKQVVSCSKSGHKIRMNSVLSLRFPPRNGNQKTSLETGIGKNTTARHSLQILPGMPMNVMESDAAGRKSQQALLVAEQEECVLDSLQEFLSPPCTFPLQSGDVGAKDETDTNTNINLEQKKIKVDNNSAVDQGEGKLKVDTKRAAHLEEDKVEIHKNNAVSLERKVRPGSRRVARWCIPSLKEEESQMKTQAITPLENHLIEQNHKKEPEAPSAKQNCFQRNVQHSFYSPTALSPKFEGRKGGLTITHLKRELNPKYSTMKMQNHPIAQILSIIGCGTPSNRKKLEYDVNESKNMVSSKDASRIVIRSISISKMSPPHPEEMVRSKTNLRRESRICVSKFQEKSPNTNEIVKRSTSTGIKGEHNFTKTFLQDSQLFVADGQQIQKLPNVKSEAMLRSEINEKVLNTQTKEKVVPGHDVSRIRKKPDLNMIKQEEKLPKHILISTECSSMLEEPKLHKQRGPTEPVWDVTTRKIQQPEVFPGTVPASPQVKRSEIHIAASGISAERPFPTYEAIKNVSESHKINTIQDKVSSDNLEEIQAYKYDDLKSPAFPEGPDKISTEIYPKFQQFTPQDKNKLTNDLKSKALELRLNMIPETAKKSVRKSNFYLKQPISEGKSCRFNPRHKKMSFMSRAWIDTIMLNSNHKYQPHSPPVSCMKTLRGGGLRGSMEIITKFKDINKQESGTSSMSSASEKPLSHTFQNCLVKEKSKLLMHFSMKTLEIQMKTFPRIVQESHATTRAQDRTKASSNCIHPAIKVPKQKNRILLVFEEKSLHQIDLDLQYKYLRFLLGLPGGSMFPKPSALPKHIRKLKTIAICKKVEDSGESCSFSIDTELLEQHISFKKQSPHENSSFRKFLEPTTRRASDLKLHIPRQKDTPGLSRFKSHVTPEKDKRYHVWFQETSTYQSFDLRTTSLSDSITTQISEDCTDIRTDVQSSANLEEFSDLDVRDSEEYVFLDANSHLSQESQNILFELQKGIPLENLDKIKKATADLKPFYSEDSDSYQIRGCRKHTLIESPSYKSHNSRKYRSSSKMKSPDWLCHSSINTAEIQSRSSTVSFREEKLSWTTRRRTSYSLAPLTESNIKLHLEKSQGKSHNHSESKERKKARFDVFIRKNNIHWNYDHSYTHSEEKCTRKKKIYESEKSYYFQSKHKSASKLHCEESNFHSKRNQNQPFFFACVPADSLETIPQTIRWTIPSKTLRKRNFRVPLVAKISNSWNLWGASKKLLGSLSGSFTTVQN